MAVGTGGATRAGRDLPAGTAWALKEWAVAVAAMEAGRQVLTLRKGGIREEGRRFRVQQEEFVLFPTYEHQKPALLRPEALPRLDEAQARRPVDGGVDVELFARVVAVHLVTEAPVVERLAGETVWTAQYAEERLRWQPSTPLFALVLQVFRLARPVHLGPDPAYGGCTSWVELRQPVQLAGAEPVLDDGAFAARGAAIEALLTG